MTRQTAAQRRPSRCYIEEKANGYTVRLFRLYGARWDQIALRRAATAEAARDGLPPNCEILDGAPPPELVR